MKRFYAIFMVICMTALVSCFSPWEGEEGTITFVFSEGDGNSADNNRHARAAITPVDAWSMTHEITLTGPGGIRETRTVTGAGSVSIAVIPGEWDISVRAIIDEPLPDGFGHYHIMRAIGFTNEPVTVRAGHPALATVQMTPAVEISSSEQLANLHDVLAYLDFAPEGNLILVLTNDIEIESTFEFDMDITLIPDGVITITRAHGHTGALFQVHGASSLTLGRPGMSGRIIIDGSGEASILGTLFYLISTSLTMYDGVTLSGNNTTAPAGGVIIRYGATFNMYGGTISNNTGGLSGGVFIDAQGTFNMHGGMIYNNRATSTNSTVSGGVGGNLSLFNQHGGRIFNNTPYNN